MQVAQLSTEAWNIFILHFYNREIFNAIRAFLS